MSEAISPAFFNFVAQVAHFSATYALSLTMLLLFPNLRRHHRWLIVFALIFAYACWHEFWYDPRYENVLTRGSDVEDWAFLVGGATTGEVVAYLKLKLT